MMSSQKRRRKPIFIIPVPHLVRDKLQSESRKMVLVPGFRRDDVWTPVFTGVTNFYELIIV